MCIQEEIIKAVEADDIGYVKNQVSHLNEVFEKAVEAENNVPKSKEDLKRPEFSCKEIKNIMKSGFEKALKLNKPEFLKVFCNTSIKFLKAKYFKWDHYGAFSDHSTRFPPFFAACNGYVESLTFLLKIGEQHMSSDDMRIMLELAVRRKHINCIKLLLDNKKITQKEIEYTLQFVKDSHIEILQLLLDSEKIVSPITNSGLMFSIVSSFLQENSTECLRLILSSGKLSEQSLGDVGYCVQLHAKDISLNCLRQILGTGRVNLEQVKWALYNVIVHLINCQNNPQFHVENKHCSALETIEFLFSVGADPEMVCLGSGKTFQELVRKLGDRKIIRRVEVRIKLKKLVAHLKGDDVKSVHLKEIIDDVSEDDPKFVRDLFLSEVSFETVRQSHAFYFQLLELKKLVLSEKSKEDLKRIYLDVGEKLFIDENPMSILFFEALGVLGDRTCQLAYRTYLGLMGLDSKFYLEKWPSSFEEMKNEVAKEKPALAALANAKIEILRLVLNDPECLFLLGGPEKVVPGIIKVIINFLKTKKQHQLYCFIAELLQSFAEENENAIYKIHAEQYQGMVPVIDGNAVDKLRSSSDQNELKGVTLSGRFFDDFNIKYNHSESACDEGVVTQRSRGLTF